MATSRSIALEGRARAFAAALLLFLAAGCKGDGGGEGAALVARGRAAYTTVCIACHNADPAKEGAVGPALAGTNLEVLRAKVLENKYPAGHKPKRATSQMVPLPQVKEDLPAIAAFLQSRKP